MEEFDLLERIKKDDEEAFRQLFHIYIKKVYQFVYGYLKNTPATEDVTQNIFQRVWEKRNMIDTSKPFGGLLFTIAYRSVIDHIRKESTKNQWTKMGITDVEEPISYLTSDALANNHHLESLYQKALNALSQKRKEVFVLSRHEGMSNAAIAKRLQISEKTVENHMTAALASLKAFFDNSELALLFPFLLFLFDK